MQVSPLIDRSMLKILAGGVAVFAVANVVNQVLGSPFWIISRSIHLGFDDNIPAWYSSMLLFVAALVGLDCFRVGSQLDIPGAWTFLIFGGMLGVLSCDEIARFHETIGSWVGNSLGLVSDDFAQHTPWIVIGAPIVLIVFGFVFLLLKQSLTLIPRSLMMLASGLSLIVLGGVVLESTINWLNHQELQWIWEAEIIVEESLEMMGSVIIAYALAIWRDEIVRVARRDEKSALAWSDNPIILSQPQPELVCFEAQAKKKNLDLAGSLVP